MPRSLHFSASTIAMSLALGLALGIPSACAMQDSTTPEPTKKKVTRSVHAIRSTPPGDQHVTEIRIEKKENNGEQDITLIINGKEFHPANEEELHEILRENGAGNVIFSHQNGDDVSLRMIAPKFREHLSELNLDNIHGQLELAELGQLHLDDAMIELHDSLGQLHELKIDDLHGLSDQLVIALEPLQNMRFDSLELEGLTDVHFEQPKSMLGVQLAPVSNDLAAYLDLDTAQCVLVQSIVDDSPAAKAGLKSNDIITGIKTPGESVRSVGIDELRSIIGQSEPGTKITLAILRKGDKKQVKVELGQWDNDVMQTDVDLHLTEPQFEDTDLEFHDAPEPGTRPQPNVFFRRSPQAPQNRVDRVPAPDDVQRQLDAMRRQLDEQMKELQKMMEELHRTQQELHKRSQGTQPEA